jgi:hypothetical protein
MPVSLAAAPSQSTTGSLVHIATAFGSVDSATISFLNIPQNFRELYIVVNGIQNNASGGITWAFNSYYTFNYSQTRMYATSVTVATDRQTSVAPLGPSFGGGTFNINPFSLHIHLIDYSSTDKFKTSLAKLATDRDTSGEIQYNAGVYPQTTAITRIDFNINNAGMWTPATSIAMYGIRAGN